jgi:hypothetical protein
MIDEDPFATAALGCAQVMDSLFAAAIPRGQVRITGASPARLSVVFSRRRR